MAERSLSSRLWYQLVQRVLQLVGVVAYQVRCTGRDNIPARGGVLMVSNHQSTFDPPVIGAGCPRRMNYLARKTLFGFAPFGWFMRSLDSIAIDRDGIGLGGIKEALRRLKRGEMVLIFPEGTRTRNGEISAFRPGFATLAVRTKATILPVAIEGAFDAWPRGQKLPRMDKIRVHYGAPILPGEIKGRGERELASEVEQRVRECLALLRRRPVPGPPCKIRA